MGQQKYTNKDTIWRNGVPYPATSRNLRRSRKSFLKEQGYGKSYHSRGRRPKKMTRAEREGIKSFIRMILFSIILTICSIFVILWLILLSLIFILEFQIKAIILSVKKIKNKKIKIFRNNKFEKDIGRLMKKAIFWIRQFHLPSNL